MAAAVSRFHILDRMPTAPSADWHEDDVVGADQMADAQRNAGGHQFPATPIDRPGE